MSRQRGVELEVLGFVYDPHAPAAESLTLSYRNSLARAREIGARTPAFPAISRGIYGFPIDQAAHIAVSTVLEDCATNGGIDEVVFVCFSKPDASSYRKELERLGLAE